MITVTDRACDVMRDILNSENRQAHAVRISVTPGGCSGFNYQIDVVEAPEAGDLPAPTPNGVKVVVDAASLPHIDGSELDYITSPLGGQFQFRNPKAVSNCGCGKSFGTQ